MQVTITDFRRPALYLCLFSLFAFMLTACDNTTNSVAPTVCDDCDDNPDDNHITSTVPITIGEETEASIYEKGDAILFTFTVPKAAQIVDVTLSWAHVTKVDYELKLYKTANGAPDGNSLIRQIVKGLDGAKAADKTMKLVYAVSAPGPYGVRVSDYQNNESDRATPFHIRVDLKDNPDQNEPNDTTELLSSAAAFTGNEITGHLASMNDVDYYKIQLNPDQLIKVELTYTGSAVDPSFEVIGGDKRYTQEGPWGSATVRKGRYLLFRRNNPPSKNEIFIRIYDYASKTDLANYQYGYDPVTPYTLKITKTTVQSDGDAYEDHNGDGNDLPQTATPLVIGSAPTTVTAKLSYVGDSDWYTFSADIGKTLVISNYSVSEAQSLLDVCFNLYKWNGITATLIPRKKTCLKEKPASVMLQNGGVRRALYGTQPGDYLIEIFDVSDAASYDESATYTATFQLADANAGNNDGGDVSLLSAPLTFGDMADNTNPLVSPATSREIAFPAAGGATSITSYLDHELDFDIFSVVLSATNKSASDESLTAGDNRCIQIRGFYAGALIEPQLIVFTEDGTLIRLAALNVAGGLPSFSVTATGASVTKAQNGMNYTFKSYTQSTRFYMLVFDAIQLNQTHGYTNMELNLFYDPAPNYLYQYGEEYDATVPYRIEVAWTTPTLGYDIIKKTTSSGTPPRDCRDPDVFQKYYCFTDINWGWDGSDCPVP